MMTNLLMALTLILPPVGLPPVHSPVPPRRPPVVRHLGRIRPFRPGVTVVVPRNDDAYQRRLIVDLCEARAVFCGWVVR